MTREQLDDLEELNSDLPGLLGLSGETISQLISLAREALELREMLRDSDIDLREDAGVFFADTRYGEGDGATPLEAINNARRGK